MKNAYQLAPEVAQRYAHIRHYDLEEIDHPDPHAVSRISYVNRIGQLLEMIMRVIPPPATVVDWGCAQGNLSLLLAERGYRVVALDLRRDFLEYARTKYENGRIDWLVANLEQSCIRPRVADVVLLCEVLEHCAFPEEILEAAATGLRSGGLLVATTPNGKYFSSQLPMLSELTDDDRKELARRQYGPAGPDHLFALTLQELRAMSKTSLRPARAGYLGSVVLTNPLARHMLRLLPLSWTFKLLHLFETLAGVNVRLSPGLFCLYVRE